MRALPKSSVFPTAAQPCGFAFAAHVLTTAKQDVSYDGLFPHLRIKSQQGGSHRHATFSKICFYNVHFQGRGSELCISCCCVRSEENLCALGFGHMPTDCTSTNVPLGPLRSIVLDRTAVCKSRIRSLCMVRLTESAHRIEALSCRLSCVSV